MDWMQHTETDPLIASMLERYLHARGDKTLADIASDDLPLDHKVYVEWHDKLGWDNFVEGRLFRHLVVIQRQHLKSVDSYLTAESWIIGLMERLLQLTHRQWSMRNAKVHFKRSDGRTIAQHERILSRVCDLLCTDPLDLEEEDRYLLDEDFEALSSASDDCKETWIANMEAALSYAAHRRCRATTTACVNDTMDSNGQTPVQIDTEGSLKYRRRRKK